MRRKPGQCLSAIAGFIALTSAAVRAAPPIVERTWPDHGEVDVDPQLREIRVKFDRPMHPGGRSVVGGGPAFPEIDGEMRWEDERTFVIPVRLKPGQWFELSINSDTFRNFQATNGESAEWYPIRFKTRAANAAPAEPDVTAEQNRAAVAALIKAIDDQYAYRDLAKVDWPAEVERQRPAMENARTANEFARHARHLLRLARDPHVSVKAAEVHLYTQPNSNPPNCNPQLVRKVVTGWTQHPGGLVSGRLGGGIGYLMFWECNKRQADDIDAALAALSDTYALIIDVRPNGGGDELAARDIAARFVEKPTVYSLNRNRSNGQWAGPFNRVVTPVDAKRYTKPVVVLIGPKVMSSAESFVLMMKHGANATLVGERTLGSSGRPMPHELGNGVTVFLSSWEDLLPDGTVLEGRGVVPDVRVQALPRELQSRDPVLEAAIAHLKKHSATQRAS